MIVCHRCHVEERILDTLEIKEWFWIVQYERYGEEHMIEWRESLPEFVRDRFVPGTVEPAEKDDWL